MPAFFTRPARRLCLALTTALLAACASEGELREAAPPPVVAPAPALPPPPPPPAAAAPLPAVPPDSIYFDSGETTLSPANQEILQRHAERIKALGGRRFAPRIVVVAHTDNVGSRSLNLAIAARRIDAVIAVLRSFGVPAGRLKRNNVSSEKVDAECASDACRRLMRRVDLIYPSGD